MGESGPVKENMPADGCGFGPFLWSERNRTGARPAPDGVRRKGTTLPISGRRGRPLREVPDGRREAVAVGRDGEDRLCEPEGVRDGDSGKDIQPKRMSEVERRKRWASIFWSISILPAKYAIRWAAVRPKNRVRCWRWDARGCSDPIFAETDGCRDIRRRNRLRKRGVSACALSRIYTPPYGGRFPENGFADAVSRRTACDRQFPLQYFVPDIFSRCSKTGT